MGWCAKCRDDETALGAAPAVDLVRSLAEAPTRGAVVRGALAESARTWSGAVAEAATRQILTFYPASSGAMTAFSRQKCHESRAAIKPSLEFLRKRFFLSSRSSVADAVAAARLPRGVLEAGNTEDRRVDGSIEDVFGLSEAAPTLVAGELAVLREGDCPCSRRGSTTTPTAMRDASAAARAAGRRAPWRSSPLPPGGRRHGVDCPYQLDSGCDVDIGYCDCDVDCDPCFSAVTCEQCGAVAADCVFCAKEGVCASADAVPTRTSLLRDGLPWSERTAAFTCELEDYADPATCEASAYADAYYEAQAWHLEAINAPRVWAMGITGAGVVVDIVDDGVDASHPDLAKLEEWPASCDLYLPAAKTATARAALLLAVGARTRTAASAWPTARVSPPARSWGGGTTPDARAIYDADRPVDVSSNSWGWDECRSMGANPDERRLSSDDACPFVSDDAWSAQSAADLCATSRPPGLDGERRSRRLPRGDRGSLRVVLRVRRGRVPQVRLPLRQLRRRPDQRVAVLPRAEAGAAERGGKGVIYVWATGNGYEHAGYYQQLEYMNNRFAITVGAVGRDLRKSSYSEGGPATFAAPASDHDDVHGMIAAIPVVVGATGDCGDIGTWTNWPEEQKLEAAKHEGAVILDFDGAEHWVESEIEVPEAEFLIESVVVYVTIKHPHRGELWIELERNGVTSILTDDMYDASTRYSDWKYLTLRHWADARADDDDARADDDDARVDDDDARDDDDDDASAAGAAWVAGELDIGGMTLADAVDNSDVFAATVAAIAGADVDAGDVEVTIETIDGVIAAVFFAEALDAADAFADVVVIGGGGDSGASSGATTTTAGFAASGGDTGKKDPCKKKKLEKKKKKCLKFEKKGQTLCQWDETNKCHSKTRKKEKKCTKAGCAWNAKKEKCADCAKQKKSKKCKKAGCKWKKSEEQCLAKKQE
ncbi:serine-type endopeptidase [Aureococcus anophagefferens]|nr:serine-type endopeptidase [Aureococcus anophagefferens]